MKKFAIILALAIACVSVFAACGKQEEPVPEPSSEEIQIPEPGPVAGGWSINTEDEYKIPEEAKAAFDKAFEGFAGVGYTPMALLGTQVVAGTNFLFLCNGTTVTAQPVTNLYVVKIYRDLEGNAEVLGIGQLDLDLIETVRANATQSEGDGSIAGGWTANSVFDDAYSKLDDMGKAAADSVAHPYPEKTYNVVALLATQVVAGENFAFLQAAPTADGNTSEFAVSFASVDLEGKATPGGTVVLSLSRLSELCEQQ